MVEAPGVLRTSLKAVLAAALTIGALGGAPAVAGAATLSGAAGTLAYTAAGGKENDVTFLQTTAGSGRVVVTAADTDPIAASGSCAAVSASPGQYECTGIATLVADAGDRDDSLSAGLEDITARLTGGAGADELGGGDAADTLDGGDGNDDLSGGEGGDTLEGGAGDDLLFGDSGADALRGGAGNDNLQPAAGADDVSGGADFDFVSVGGSATPPPDVSVTLDDRPNDGPAGAGANVHSDIEDVDASSSDSTAGAVPGNVTIVGTAGANRLSIRFVGKGSITGGAGNDWLSGGFYDDTINARDGFADRVQCGGGADLAIVDTLDSVSGDCETIQSQDVGNADEDRPPAVAFTSPAANAASVGTRRATTLTATATDDKGVAKVQFIDDERIVCEDTTAPYSCAYRPRGGDVGRNTLAAVAVDTSQQTATALRTVRVGRFAPRGVTLKVSPGRDAGGPRRFTASGRVSRPARVSAAQGCRGAVVSVQVKAGSQTISNRRAKLRSDCTYRRRVSFTDPGRLPASGVLRFTARYQGNAVMAAKRSKPVRARTR